MILHHREERLIARLTFSFYRCVESCKSRLYFTGWTRWYCMYRRRRRRTSSARHLNSLLTLDRRATHAWEIISVRFISSFYAHTDIADRNRIMRQWWIKSCAKYRCSCEYGTMIHRVARINEQGDLNMWFVIDGTYVFVFYLLNN